MVCADMDGVLGCSLGDFSLIQAVHIFLSGGKPFLLGWESIIFDVKSTSTGHCRPNEQEKP